MADQEQVERLKQGFAEWNAWREQHPEIRPDLTKADLSGADLSGAELGIADLRGANLSGANLRGAANSAKTLATNRCRIGGEV